ncbi:MAG: NYN domain-containing protein [Candidatus Dojkabacteria bacterium]
MKKEEVYVFIDSQNLNLGIKSLGWELDFKKFYIFLKDKYRISKAFVFIGFMEENKGLYKFLEKCGFNVIYKPAIKFGKKSIKGNVDAELVLHAAKIQYKNYKQAIIVSGDGDFYCLIEDMLKEKRLLKIIIPNRKSQSSLLKDFEKYKHFLDKERQKLERHKK